MKALRQISIFALGLTLVGPTVRAQDIKLAPDGEPLPFTFSPGAQTRNEPSAIALIGNGLYLVADDDVPSLGIFNAQRRLLNCISLQQALPKANPCKKQGPDEDVKWEAMAKDDDYFYVIGAHNVRPREGREKLKSRSRMFRFKLKNASDPLEIDVARELNKEFDLKDSLTQLGLYDSRNPDTSKVKIEGLAVRKNAAGQTELIFGLREPLCERCQPKNVVEIYSATPDPKNNGPLEALQLKPLFTFAAQHPANNNWPFHLSSIEYVPSWRGFLVMTSTEDDNNKFFGNKLWFFSDTEIAAKFKGVKSIEELEPLQPNYYSREFENDTGKQQKAEGLTVVAECDLGLNEKLIKVAIVFDNDGPPGGKMQFVQLSKPPK